MDLSGQASQARFASYVEALVEVIGHADRAEPLNDYCVGLLMPGERKSVEPMAAIVAPARVSAKHQSLLHLVGQAPWSDEAVLQKIRELVLPGIERQGRIEAWIVDDTGFTKKGTHSVGVARQYCGRLGKQDNCQVAVTLSIANHSASLPIAYRLYLPETWANDAARRKKTHVPKDIRFKTKPQIALDQIRAAHAEGVAPGIVLADAGYGANSDFRAGVSALNLPYVVGIQSTPSVWPPSQAPLPPKPWSGRGRRPCNVQRDDEHKPVSVKDLALSLGKKAWRSVTWREGSNAPLASRFATVRVHLAARDYKRTTPHPVEWLLVEWPKGEAAPTKYWLSTLGAPSPSRWCDGTFDVLYTSLERDGALAEIYALLSIQPVFPSKVRFSVHKVTVSTRQTLRFADLTTLGRLGVDVSRYRERNYAKTQAIADAAYFLGFDGLIAPSARWECLNAILFTDRLPPGDIEIAKSEQQPVNWDAWRKRTRT